MDWNECRIKKFRSGRNIFCIMALADEFCGLGEERMMRMFKDMGRDTGNEQGMTYKKLEKSRDAGDSKAASDPLGPNSEIGRKLKQYYDELVAGDIPDRFNQLLSELERKEQPQSLATED